MKQAALISVLIFFLFDAAGTYFYYELSIHHARRQASRAVQSGKRQEEFVTFLVNKKDYHEIVWLGKKEFRYRGEWYDVVSHRENDEGFLFTCYHDEREEEASAGLSRFVDSRTNESPLLSSKSFLKAFDKYCPETRLLFLKRSSASMLFHHEAFSPHNLFSPAIPTPPPNAG